MQLKKRSFFSEQQAFSHKCFTNFYLSSLLFVLCFSFITAFFSDYFSKQYLAHRIKTDSQQLLSNYSIQLRDYSDLFDTLNAQFLYDCGAYDKQQLKSIAYNDYLIRRITLELPNGKTCTSFDSADIDTDMIPLMGNLTDDISLWVVRESRTDQQIMVAEKESEHGSILLYMEPLISDALRHKYCENCVLTSLSPENDVTVSFWRGDAALLSESPILSTVFADGLRLNAFVNNRLIEKYRNEFWLPLFLIGGLIGVVCLIIHRLVVHHRMSLHSLVERGLAKQEFIPYYQPIVDVSTNSLYGCEMLARWKRAGHDLIAPMEFIPYVEKSGQIYPITDQLITKTVREISKLNWHLTQQVISINVVPGQLESPDIMQKSLALLHNSEIAPSQIAFEVTERKQFTNLTMASSIIEELRRCGIGVKLDDAGTGYGGFRYIQQLNIRSLKIDKMFVETIGTSDIKLSLLDSIIAFGKEAEMEMIAEGVETYEQSVYLAQRGVILQQGYYFGKPMNFRDFAYYCKSMISRDNSEKEQPKIVA
ncbi:EAL domain-containing protein [Photobacterium nomapromontoriensis]|uniref:EAL domain-containing protein n=1 Tax=Photobacterium nomapromontoriensis TaxID=2910237 RepID=UPI003D11A4AA